MSRDSRSATELRIGIEDFLDMGGSPSDLLVIVAEAMQTLADEARGEEARATFAASVKRVRGWARELEGERATRRGNGREQRASR